MANDRKHIELFAGCGGMAIGMKQAGFDIVFANEVSPMAANTFAKNLMGIDLERQHKKVKWIHSRFDEENYESRLRENLLSHGQVENCGVDFSKIQSLDGNLLIGDVRQLNALLEGNNIRDPYNGSLDLISGGPPCQSFSLAGKRELGNYKNRLPLDFAEICEKLNPKVVLLENVKGILSAFNVGGHRHYAWLEVAKAFAIKGYAPICMLVNSKFFGIAQNRPRYIMIALRQDVFDKLKAAFPHNKILEMVGSFCQKALGNLESLTTKDLDFYDMEKETGLFDGVILPAPTTFDREKWVSVKDAIQDLSGVKRKGKSEYVREINSFLSLGPIPKGGAANHHFRSHSPKVKRRFLFLQLLNYCNGYREELLSSKKANLNIPPKRIKELYSTFHNEVNGFGQLFSNHGELSTFINDVDLTKKHSQRALNADLPAPAQLTIPDDMCHYSISQQRVLTVREIARIQSFPDSFVFKSKETTGGGNRKYEVPQYTQVGNAVPPKLAYHLGVHIKGLLSKAGV